MSYFEKRSAIVMGVNKNLPAASDSSHLCGVIFDPLAEETIEIGDLCKEEDSHEWNDLTEEDHEIHPFYLGNCGLIMDYLL
jgi:hypothetical protein